MLFKCWCFKYFITCPWLYAPIFILPRKMFQYSYILHTLYMISCRHDAKSVLLYTWFTILGRLFCSKMSKSSQRYMSPSQLICNATHKWNLSLSHIYWLSTTNSYLLPVHKLNSNAFLYTASDLKLVWGSMICSVQSLYTGNMHKHRLCILLYTYFLYFTEKLVVPWWFCKSTQSAGCFQSMLINPVMNSNFRKNFCTLFRKSEVAYMCMICFVLVRLWRVSFLLTLLHCWAH